MKKKSKVQLRPSRPVQPQNSQKSWVGILCFIFTRNITLVILAVFVIWIITDISKVNVGAKIRLNKFSQPSEFVYLTRFMNGQEPFRREKFIAYQYYYEQALQKMSEKAAVKTLLGYCHFVLSDYNLSAKFFNEALGSNPEIFWPFYNLGLMSYQAKKYEQAEKILKEAVGRNPFETVKFFHQSEKIYRPILASARVTEPELIQNLKQGYQDSYIVLIASHYYLSDYQGMLEASLNAIKAKVEQEALFLFYAGSAQYFLKNYAEAVRLLNESIAADQNQRTAYYYLGLSYKAMGSKKLFEETKSFWIHLTEEEKNIRFPTQAMKLRLF